MVPFGQVRKFDTMVLSPELLDKKFDPGSYRVEPGSSGFLERSANLYSHHYWLSVRVPHAYNRYRRLLVQTFNVYSHH
jgi:hypothetical protein